MVNERFQKLPEEKRQEIVNAALEVFAKNEYKHASTDLIASKAGISKGLLFYYFKNKRELYLYLMDYLEETVTSQLLDPHFYEIDDFFDLLEYGGEKKCQIVCRNPYMMEFSVRAFYSTHQDIKEDLDDYMQEKTSHMFRQYFKAVDLNKFQEDVNPEEILQMMMWMTDGYMHQQMNMGKNVELEGLIKLFRSWMDMFRRISYKKEYL
ncbi:TetR/AcrR family transcriptional regulator [Qiania dongpingensis]|uniref:TetR/AcrR family transcriptional regulator n=1 Tax=Qiania dongpingensis TaxID=2763669 RepID=A0A7G9G3T0_9FIRM|nr:TetR/AcrR family transcriptional regulator [Qiania dongpingensis]QNM05462.1 TetR/AcrR family transcriptional regulator [Qiania dongpingensis]